MSGDVSFGQVEVSNSLIEISFVPDEVLSGLDKAHSGFNGARKTSDKPPLVFNGVTKMS
jgi:hypothetical protein